MYDANLLGTCSELSCCLDTYDGQWLYQTSEDIYALVPGQVSNIKGKYMPSVLRAVLHSAFTVRTIYMYL